MHTEQNKNQSASAWESNLAVALFMALAFFLASGVDAFAGLLSAVTTVQTEANSVVVGLANLAVFALGVGAVFGRISVTQALVVATGITIAAHAGDISALIKGDMSDSVDDVDDVAHLIRAGLGIISIIVLGIGFMFGKISATQALAVAVGVALLGGYRGIAGDIIQR